MKKLILIDGHSIVNRAFYGVPDLTNSEGKHTNAIFGFLNIMFKQCEDEKPDYLAVAFDLPTPTFRHLQYSEYKGNRKPMPDELREQIPVLKELLEKMSIKLLTLEGYEADDILGTVSTRAEQMGVEVIVVSGDKDMLQLAGEKLKIRIPKTKKGKTEIEDYYASDVVEKYGVTPTEYIEVKALMGDTSDNIPGVPGIGEITALKIITQYHTLENAIENAAIIKPKRASENIAAYKEQAFLSRELATININSPVQFSLDDCAYTGIFSDEVIDFFKRLEFKSLLRNFPKKVETVKTGSSQKINTTESLNKILSVINKQLTVSCVFIYYKDKLCGIAISLVTNESFYIEPSNSLTEENIFQTLKPFFENHNIKKFTFDVKSDMHQLNKHGVRYNGIELDAMIADYLINPLKTGAEYSSLAMDYLGETFPTLDEVLKKDKSKLKWSELSEQEAVAFASGYSSVILRVSPIIIKKLEQQEMHKLYYEIEHPLINVLFHMEQQGICVDTKQLNEFGEKVSHEISRLEAQIHEMAGEQFNINSPKQLGVILFEKLGLHGGKKNKTGYSTAADVLERLAHEHPIVNDILEYRTYTKLNSTYVEGLLKVVKDGKIYTTFNQAITATGRLSSTEPNLQNIPIRLPLGRELRKVFVAKSEQYTFLDADYSQIELRVLAHISGDETLINAYKTGLDIHRLTASQVCGVSYDEVTPAQRSSAKAVNFGIVYGIGAFSLSQDLKITRKEADRYINAYFSKYPNVKKYLDNIVVEATNDGYVKTIFGRRRPMPELSASNFVQRSFGERVAMNMPIQGTAADIIKIAMNRIFVKLENYKSKILLQVHDELLIEAHKDELEEVKQILKTEMENAVDLLVPMEVDVHQGATWFDAK